MALFDIKARAGALIEPKYGVSIEKRPPKIQTQVPRQTSRGDLGRETQRHIEDVIQYS